MTASKKLFTITVTNPNGRPERLILHFINEGAMRDRATELLYAGYEVEGVGDYPVSRDPDRLEAMDLARALLGEAR